MVGMTDPYEDTGADADQARSDDERDAGWDEEDSYDQSW